VPTSDDIIWALYEDSVAQGRHHETQRLGMTNAILVATAASLGIVGIDSEISVADLPVGLFLVVLGGFGALFSLKQYERFRNHMAFAKVYRDAVGDDRLTTLRASAKKAHRGEWAKGWRGRLLRSRLFAWWASFHLIIAALGLAVVALSLIEVG
jgi:hypothetical protein